MQTGVHVLVAAVLLVGCAGGNGAAAPSRFGPVRSIVAKSKQPEAIRCPDNSPYDSTRGCIRQTRFGETVRIEYKHDFGPSFALVGAAFAIDGKLIFDSNDPKWMSRDRFVVSDAKLATGPHELGVYLYLRGEGHGVFSYLRDYRFQVRSSEQLEVEGPIVITVVGHERGGATTPLEERPAVRYVKDRR